MLRHFFYVVFGGLAAIVGGVVLAYIGRIAYHEFRPELTQFKSSAFELLASAVTSQSTDGTFISGLKRTVRYTASEEEDAREFSPYSIEDFDSQKISAPVYLLRNLTDGKVISESNSEKLVPIASVTKLVTAAVAKRVMDGKEKIVITREVISTYGNTGALRVGETFAAKDLLYPLLMVSSNDAAEALARGYGRAKFIKAMNDFAQEIGAYRTMFHDPSGLSADNRSTAMDVAIILDYIRLNDPEIIAITDEKTRTVRSHTWVNPTHFLSWSNYIGGKNGYTDEANRTGASLFEVGKAKKIYAVVVLGSGSRDVDVAKLLAKVGI